MLLNYLTEKIKKLFFSGIDLPAALIIYIGSVSLSQWIFTLTELSIYGSYFRILLFVLFLIYCFVNIKRPIKIRGVFLISLLSLLVYFFLNIAIVRDSMTSPTEIMNIAFPPIAFLLFYVLIGNYKMDRAGLLRFLNYFIFLVIIYCVINVVVNFNTIINISTYRFYEVNLASVFDNRNTFGLYLFLGIASCIFALSLHGRQKGYLLASLLFFGLNLLLTMSRTSMIAVVIFIVIYSLLNRRFLITIGVSLAIGVIALAGFSYSGFSNFIVDNIFREESGLSGRDAVYEGAQQLIREETLLLGSGINNADTIMGIQTGFESTHNTYLGVIIKGGVVLSFFFVLLMFFIIKRTALIYSRERPTGSYLFALIVAYLIYSLAESRYLFFYDIKNFVITVFIALIPLYVSNYYLVSNKKGAHYV